ncbi:MAG: hypothetical protein ACRDLY_15925, partial [Thermoleophilaceae bacterium]
MRYDPDTGARVKVTQDDPRWSAWSNRKPSKRSRELRERRESPIAYEAQKSLGRVQRAAATAAGNVGASVARRV